MAADQSASSAPPSQQKTMITDLNEDSLSHCATYLTLQDLSNLAMTCKSLKRAAYSDSIWEYWLRFQIPISPFLLYFVVSIESAHLFE